MKRMTKSGVLMGQIAVFGNQIRMALLKGYYHVELKTMGIGVSKMKGSFDGEKEKG